MPSLASLLPLGHEPLLPRRAEDRVHPHLVVVPLSTLPNWEREFALWAPQLNVVVFHGTQAAREVIKQHELYAPAIKASAGTSWQVAPC